MKIALLLQARPAAGFWPAHCLPSAIEGLEMPLTGIPAGSALLRSFLQTFCHEKMLRDAGAGKEGGSRDQILPCFPTRTI